MKVTKLEVCKNQEQTHIREKAGSWTLPHWHIFPLKPPFQRNFERERDGELS